MKRSQTSVSFGLILYGIAWSICLPLLKGAVLVDQWARKLMSLAIIPSRWRVEDRLVRNAIFGSNVDTPPMRQATLWLHAASLGEAKGLWALVQALTAGNANSGLDSRLSLKVPIRILVTANTATGFDFLRIKCSDLRQEYASTSVIVAASIAPFDHPSLVDHFLTLNRVTTLCLYEAEIWPHYIQGCKVREIPSLLVSARISSRAYAWAQKFPTAGETVLASLNWIQAQSKTDLARFKSLGAGEISTGFDLKAAHYLQAYTSSPQTFGGVPNLNEGLSGRARLAFISLHVQELRLLLPAFPGLLTRFDILIFPRHLDQMPQFGRLLKPFKGAQGFEFYSINPQSKHLLVDSLGLVELLLPSCQLAFVGGSLIPIGCHNLWEPLLVGLKIYFGPYYANQIALADPLLELGLAQVITQGGQIENSWDSQVHRSEVGQRFVEECRSALVEALEECRARIFASLDNSSGKVFMATPVKGNIP